MVDCRMQQAMAELGQGYAVADSASAGAVPAIMEAYRSGGTSWFVVIAPNGRVVYDGFRLDAESLVQALRPLAA